MASKILFDIENGKLVAKTLSADNSVQTDASEIPWWPSDWIPFTPGANKKLNDAVRETMQLMVDGTFNPNTPDEFIDQVHVLMGLAEKMEPEAPDSGLFK